MYYEQALGKLDLSKMAILFVKLRIFYKIVDLPLFLGY